MNFISLQRDVAALYFGVLGKHADRATLEYFAKKLHTGELTASSMANVFINADDGKARLAALDDAEKFNIFIIIPIASPPMKNNFLRCRHSLIAV